MYFDQTRIEPGPYFLRIDAVDANPPGCGAHEFTFTFTVKERIGAPSTSLPAAVTFRQMFSSRESRRLHVVIEATRRQGVLRGGVVDSDALVGATVFAVLGSMKVEGKGFLTYIETIGSVSPLGLTQWERMTASSAPRPAPL